MTSESLHSHPLLQDVPACIVSIEDTYEKRVQEDEALSWFDKLLAQFIVEYFQGSKLRPKQCVFTLFTYPGEEYQEPMIKIIYSQKKAIDALAIKDDLEARLKQYLAKNSENIAEFKLLRKVQQRFRVIIRRG